MFQGLNYEPNVDNVIIVHIILQPLPIPLLCLSVSLLYSYPYLSDLRAYFHMFKALFSSSSFTGDPFSLSALPPP